MEKKVEEGKKGSKIDVRRKALIILVIITISILVYGTWMIKHRMDYAITDAVFVDTDSINNVGFERVGGKIIKMTKSEGDKVRKGEIIAEIDPLPYKLLEKEIKATLEAKRKEKERLEIVLFRISKQIVLKEGVIRDRISEIKREKEALKKTILSLDASILQLKRDKKRYEDLYKKGAVAKRDFEMIETELMSKIRGREAAERRLCALSAKLMATKKELAIAVAERKRIDETKKMIGALKKEINSLEAKLKDARLNLDYCKLKSPINGRVAKKYVSLGDVVSPGTPIYALVDPKDIYILVLLEETKLKGIFPGCPAKIKIDAYPNLKYMGEVEEILPTSAAKFALVPRDISAGEFTKVVQRIQVKVRITKGDVSKLVVGMGGEVEIKRRKKWKKS